MLPRWYFMDLDKEIRDNAKRITALESDIKVAKKLVGEMYRLKTTETDEESVQLAEDMITFWKRESKNDEHRLRELRVDQERLKTDARSGYSREECIRLNLLNCLGVLLGWLYEKPYNIRVVGLLELHYCNESPLSGSS